MSALAFDPRFNRTTRAGSWNDLKTGTFTLARQALSQGRRQEAVELAGFFVDEARIIFGIYTQWLPNIRRCMTDKGMNPRMLASEEANLAALVFARFPDVARERSESWARVEDELERLRTTASGGEASAHLDSLRDRWRELHDSDVDYIAGLMDIIVRHFGEAAIGEMYDGWVIGDWFDKRYSKFDVSKHAWDEIFEELVYLSFESMHAHLAGPGRDGSVGLDEFDDRVTLRFAPCGSGGRTVGGDPETGRASLMEPPFNFSALKSPHDFSWNKPGICPYCAHCCVILEKLPIERFGYPVRVVDPPVQGSEKPAVCSWTMYKDPRDVPASVYERLGRSRPPPELPLGSAGTAERRERGC